MRPTLRNVSDDRLCRLKSYTGIWTGWQWSIFSKQLKSSSVSNASAGNMNTQLLIIIFSQMQRHITQPVSLSNANCQTHGISSPFDSSQHTEDKVLLFGSYDHPKGWLTYRKKFLTLSGKGFPFLGEEEEEEDGCKCNRASPRCYGTYC
jgi:hypothetical protein